MSVNETIRKLKSKDATLTALAHVDSGVGADEEMMEALRLTDKMTVLKNASLKWYSDLSLEKRPILTALEVKLVMLETQLAQIAENLDALDLPSTKVMKNRRDYFNLQRQLREFVENISETLGDKWSAERDSPFLHGFLNK